MTENRDEILFRKTCRMPRYKLRTLLILLAILPPLLGVAWMKYAEWKAEQERQKVLRALVEYERAFNQTPYCRGRSG